MDLDPPQTSSLPEGPRHTVARYTTYADAQRAVDRLSDEGFPVETVAIVGGDLRLVEAVTGRLTTGRAALAGAASGAWFGLLIGLLLSLFVEDSAWLGVLGVAILIGAFWGAVFGFVAHAATRGKRDFASLRTLAAGWYEVTVADEHAGRARQLLAGTA